MRGQSELRGYSYRGQSGLSKAVAKYVRLYLLRTGGVVSELRATAFTRVSRLLPPKQDIAAHKYIKIWAT